MAWIGKKKLAFIPVFRPFMESAPPDWIQQIEQRVYRSPVSGTSNMALREHIVETSNGRADLEGHVLPIQEINRIDVPPTALAGQFESGLRAQGFDAAALVMLGQPPSGTADGGKFWVRFVMAEGVGVWAMEFVHVLTGLSDLRSFGDIATDLGSYDNMSSARGTHPTSYTKRDIGWLDPASVTRHAVRTAAYSLHTTALAQPAPAGRTTAVQVGTEPPILLVEARQKVDQFDAGITAEGVIVYEVMKLETGATPGFRRPHIELRTPQGLQPGQGFTSDTGVKVNVLATIVGGFTVSVDDPNFHLTDRSGSLGAPNAASAVTVALIPATSTYDIAYRAAGSSHLFELWNAPGGDVGRTDLTAVAQGGAPNAAGNPFFYTDTSRNQVILLFRDGGGTVRSLYWTTGAVGHDNLSGTAQAPAAAGDPTGYYDPANDIHHVIYRGAGGRLHELWWAGVAPVGYGGDLTAQAPRAAGDPSAYFDPVRGNNLVFYRATDNHIRDLYWPNGPGQPTGEDLSGSAGTPPAAGNPWAYYTAHDDVHQIVYRAANGHIHELFWPGVEAVVGWDLTAQSGAPPSAGDPTAYYHAVENTKHVIYRGANGTLHEIWWVPGGGTPAHVNLTAAYGAPAAADKPYGFSVPWDGTQHVAYRGADGHVYELVW